MQQTACRELLRAGVCCQLGAGMEVWAWGELPQLAAQCATGAGCHLLSLPPTQASERYLRFKAGRRTCCAERFQWCSIGCRTKSGPCCVRAVTTSLGLGRARSGASHSPCILSPAEGVIALPADG